MSKENAASSRKESNSFCAGPTYRVVVDPPTSGDARRLEAVFLISAGLRAVYELEKEKKQNCFTRRANRAKLTKSYEYLRAQLKFAYPGGFTALLTEIFKNACLCDSLIENLNIDRQATPYAK